MIGMAYMSPRHVCIEEISYSSRTAGNIIHQIKTVPLSLAELF